MPADCSGLGRVESSLRAFRESDRAEQSREQLESRDQLESSQRVRQSRAEQSSIRQSQSSQLDQQKLAVYELCDMMDLQALLDLHAHVAVTPSNCNWNSPSKAYPASITAAVHVRPSLLVGLVSFVLLCEAAVFGVFGVWRGVWCL